MSPATLAPTRPELLRALQAILPPEEIRARWIDRLTYARDASVYRMVPEVVVRPRHEADVTALMGVSRRLRVPLTFRAGGTSLSGQSVTEGILVDVSRHFRGASVEEGGGRVRVQPGVIGARVNQLVSPFGNRMGPDPASIAACMMGGILANNSSGMCCGTEQNAYRTLEEVVAILPSGRRFQWVSQGSQARPGAGGAGAPALTEADPDLARHVMELRRSILERPELVDLIRTRYRMKNTCGYGLNSFLDHEEPGAILAHLLIGSEGTLGFLAEAVLRTVPDPPCKVTGWFSFATLPAACAAIPELRETGAVTMELLDKASLLCVRDLPGVPVDLAHPGADGAALLVEWQAAGTEELDRRELHVISITDRLATREAPLLTRDPGLRAGLWKVRKGLFPAVGARRPAGTAVIIEDIAFPPERLAAGLEDLRRLFHRHGYEEAILFGHARDGNVHFVITPDFGQPEEVDRYDVFLREMVELVARDHGGALKAEHGTGRNMAPFLEREWGVEGARVHRDIKDLADPDGILNPGVIINRDPNAHMAYLKPLPPVAPEVDRCIECGFCEPVCPSRDLTLTPRRRIAALRELALLEPGTAAARETRRDYHHEGIDTCVTDGMCALSCPVAIDTGKAMVRLAQVEHPAWARAAARWIAGHRPAVEAGARFGLGVMKRLESMAGPELLAHVTGRISTLLGHTLPVWDPRLPEPARPGLPRTGTSGAGPVYVPCCLNRILGPDDPRLPPLPHAVVDLARWAGVPLWIPDRVETFCCGLPFQSKGFPAAHEDVVGRAAARLEEWSRGGQLPVFLDTTPCVASLRSSMAAPGVTLLDPVEFLDRYVCGALPLSSIRDRVVFHPTCSSVRSGDVERMRRVGLRVAREVIIPARLGCCGMGGDRGLKHPGLPRSATVPEAEDLAGAGGSEGYSTSRTCELGMSMATGRSYRSLIYLFREAAAAAEERA